MYQTTSRLGGDVALQHVGPVYCYDLAGNNKQFVIVSLKLNFAHLDIFPVPVLRLVDIGPQLGGGSTGSHEVVRQVPGPDQAQHQVVLHDPRQLRRILLEFVDSLELIISQVPW